MRKNQNRKNRNSRSQKRILMKQLLPPMSSKDKSQKEMLLLRKTPMKIAIRIQQLVIIITPQSKTCQKLKLYQNKKKHSL